MANRPYEIKLGVNLDKSTLNNIKKQLTGLTDNTYRVRIDIDNSRLLKQIQHAKSELKNLNNAKGSNETAVSIDTKSLKESLNDVSSIIKEIRNSIGTIDNKSGMKSLLSSVNQIATALGKVENESDNLVKSLSALSKKDFSINFDLKMGKSASQISSEQGDIKRDAISQLKQQAKALEDYLDQYYKVSQKQEGVVKLTQGTNLFSAFWEMSPNIGNTKASLKQQVATLKQYIDLMQEAAKIKGIDLSSVTSGFSQTTSDIVEGTKKVSNGAEEIKQAFKGIFGGSLDVEGLSGQLQPIIADLGEIKTALQSLSSNNSIDGLTQSFNRLSETLENLTSNFVLLKNGFGNELSGASNADIDAVEKIEKASDSSTSTIVQNEKKKKQAIRQTAEEYEKAADKADDDSKKDISLTKASERINKKLVGSDLGFSKYDNEIDSAYTKFNKLENQTEQLTSDMNALDDAFDSIKAASSANDVERLVSANKSYEEILARVKNQLDINLRAEKEAATIAKKEASEKAKAEKQIAAAQKQEDAAGLKETNNELKKLKDLAGQIGDLDFKIKKSNFNDEINQVKEFERQLELLKTQFNSTLDTLNGKNVDIGSDITKEFVKARNKMAEFDAKIADTKEKLAESIKLDKLSGSDLGFSKIDKEILDVTNKFNNLTKQPEILEAGIQSLNVAFKGMKDAANANDIEGLINAYENYQNVLKNVQTQLQINITKEKEANAARKLADEKVSLKLDMVNWLKKNTKAADEYEEKINTLVASLDNLDEKGLEGVRRQFKNLTKDADLKGLTGLTTWDRLIEKAKEYASYLSAAELFMYAEQALRSMFEQVKAIDSAMTELKKVTNETDAAYNQFLSDAASRAKEIGTTIDGLVTSTADFARLGYGFKESQELAEVANIYTVVGDEIDGVETATQSLISTMTAFGVQASDSMSIIDKFNEVSNNFAISSGGIGEALQRSASSMAAANNTIDETIALITAANTVVQDPDAVGTAFKTISMRIRGAKTELEEAGLETEGMATSVSTLRSEIMALSGVDIMLNNNEFKSTYKIIEELAAKWEDLSDIQQATVTELIAGKRQGNIISSLMENFDIADRALQTSLDSSGSAMAEHAKWSESLEARLNKLKSTWQSLSQSFMSSDFLKGALDGVIGLVNGVNKLIDTFGMLPTLMGAFAAFESFKGVGFFQTIEDEATLSGKRIQSTFAQALSGVFKNTSFSFSMGFEAALADDVVALQNYISKLQQGVPAEEAFAQTMRQASTEAQHFAQTMNTATMSASQFETIARQSQITEQAKSFKNAKALINEYNSGLQNCKLTQTEFIGAVGKSNTNFAKYLSGLNGAKASMSGYITSLVGAKVATFALEAATMALNAALTMGISFAISAVVSAISKWINSEEELAEKVQEATSKYKEQHSELMKLKGDYDTTNESSMISKYEKLSKGVDNLGRNVSLTSEEYSEYQSIINSIADQIPELVTGYDSHGNAILSCKDNVEALTAAYEKLIHAQNQEILTHTDGIEQDFANTLENASGKGLWSNNHGFWAGFAVPALGGDYDLKEDTIKNLEILLSNVSKSEKNKAYQNLNADRFSPYEIRTALKDAGIEIGTFESPLDALEETLKTDPQKIRNIVDDYYNQFSDAVEEQKTIAQAKLSDAFDISSVISGLNYVNISEELQNIAYQTVSSLDYDFFSKLSESGKSVEQWTTEMLDQLNSISKVDNAEIEAAFDLQTQFNGGDISYGQYVKSLKNVESTIDRLGLKPEVEEQIKISLGLDENGIVDQYDALVERLTSKEIGLDNKAARKFLDGLSAEEFSVAMDIIPKLDAGTTVSEIQKLIDEKLADEFTFDIAVQMEGIEAFNTALSEARSATGLTAESISALKGRYEDLEGFNAGALFETTANGVRVNNEELARLESQYEEINKLDINKNLNTLVGKYKDLTEQIKTCTDVQEKESLQAQADAYADKIEDLQILQSQYDGLTSSFAKWQQAQSSANNGDNYDSVFENLENIQKLYKQGLVGTDDFKTFAQLMSNEDLSTATVEQHVSAYKKGLPIVKRYFTEGQKGCKKFLNDLNKVNSEWAHINEDGDWEINIDVEEAAKELDTSVDFIYLILDKLKDYGFEVNIDDSSIGNLQTEIEKSEAKLKELGQTPHKVNLDVSDVEAIDTEIKNLETHIDKIKNDSSISVEAKTAQLDDAHVKLEALIQKKQEASQPSFMNLDTSQVRSSMVKALGYVQEYQDALNDLNMLLELEEAGIVIDDSEIDAAQQKLDECAKLIQSLDSEVKLAIGLEEDASIDDIKAAITNGDIVIDTDTSTANVKIEKLADNVERIEDKNVTINVTVNGLEDVEELNRNIDLATNIDGDIDSLSEYVKGAKALSDLDSNIVTNVTANITGNVKDTPEFAINNLETFAKGAEELKGVGTFSSKVTADIEGNVKDTPEFSINNLKVFSDSAKEIESIGNVESKVTADISGNVKDTPEYMINNLKAFTKNAKDIDSIGEDVKAKITADIAGNVKDTPEFSINNLKAFTENAKDIENIGEDVKAKITADIEGNVKDTPEFSINNLKVFTDNAKDIEETGNVESKVTANVDGNVIDEFEYKLNNLKVFSDSAKDIDDIGTVESKVTANIDGNVVDTFEYKINNLKSYSENASDVEKIGDVSSKVSANVEGNVVDTFEYKINNLKVFSDSAKDIESVGNVESKVTANVDGNVIDTFEYKINNLKAFTDSAKDIDDIGNVSSSVKANIDGNVIEEFEYKINNLKTFSEGAESIKDIGDVESSVSANIDGNVIDEFEYKINNLSVFSDNAKDLKDIGTVESKVTANIEGNVIDTFEYKINNLKTYTDSAKDLKDIGTVTSKATADVEGNVVDTYEYKIDNLKVYTDSAKKVKDIGTVTSKVTANVEGNVIDTYEYKIDNLELFGESAKKTKNIGTVNSSVTANVDGNVINTTEEKIDNLGVFADNANKLKNTGNFSSSVSANVNGNIITDDTVITDLEHFASIVSGMSNQTVAINVTANVDSANINQAITLLTNVSNSGVFKDYNATVQVGAKIATIDDTTVKNYKVPQKDGKVSYSVSEDSPVYTWTAPSKDGVVNYDAKVDALTDAQKHKRGTITYDVKISGFPVVNGTANANGTAFVNGTSGKAYRQGDWGAKKTETALTGELGQELVVYKNRYWTVGDNGAEFATIPKGAIVFNHKQTEELFKNGRVTSDGGRGRALAEGTAYKNATGVGAFYNSTTGGSYGSKDSSSDTDRDFEEVLDWIEIIIDRVERSIDKFDQQANNIYKSWSSRNKALQNQISEINKEIGLQQQAYNKYISAANGVGLSSSWAAKVRNGEIDIETIKDEVLAEKIKDYQNWYEKALDCKDAIEELKETESKLYAQRVENIASEYEGVLGVIEYEKNMLEEYINQSEAQAWLVSANYYNALADNERDNVAQLKKEKAAMLAELQSVMESGTIVKGSEAWYEMVNSIDEVTLAITESETQLLEYQQTIQQLSWETFDLLQEKISSITEETEFLIDLMSNDKLFDDNGRLTNEGSATMGLHGVAYNTYMYQADQAAIEAERLKKELAKDPYDTELEECYREMISLQQEYILAAEDEKDAIRDLVKEGIDLELDALQERIDKYNESIESAKDLYDYQKNIKEQTEEIASLEKQMSAYAGDNSEEAKSKIQELKVSLEEARADLEETEYDKYISDQQQLLDELYIEYETILNARLDNIDALISDMITEINNDSVIIGDTIREVADSVGYTLSDSMQTIWSNNTTNITGVITTYGDKFANAQTTTNNALSTINTNLQNVITQLNKLAKTNVKSASSSSASNSSQANATKKTTSTTTNKTTTTDTPKAITVGGKINAKGAQIYDYAGDKSGERQLYRNDPIYKVLKTDGNWIQVRWHKLSSGITGWFKKGDVKAYATGKKNFFDDEIAWTQENGQEFIVRPSDGAILTPIAKGDSVLNANASSNIWNMANSPAEFIKDNLNLGVGNVPNNSNVQSNYTQHLDNVVFNLPNVKNYDELLSAMQKDKNFERLILSMSIDRLAGKSSLAKGKSIR